MHSNPVLPAYSPPITTPPGAMGGPIIPMAGPYGPMEGAMDPYMSNIPPPSHSSQQSSTTVIINQMMPTNTGPRIWSSSVCSCCDDMGSCLLGAFCPCILASQIAGDMGESCCVPCCVPGWLIVLRTKLRAENKITGTVMDDCCTVCCCGLCVMCQMKRELKFIRYQASP